MMDDLLKQKNELLEAVKSPERKKSEPSNFALYAALIFANVIFCLLDIISGITVYYMTGIPLYGVLTFLAGFVPLVMHETLFTRAYASEDQRRLAMIGAITGFCSIIIIGVMAGYVNIVGVSVAPQAAEITTIIALIMIASFHALLATWYFYIDNGVSARQQTAQAVARAHSQADLIEAGDLILSVTQKSVNNREQIGKKYNNLPALYEVLKQMGYPDLNGDGIPDVLQQKRPQQMQYNASAEKPPQLHDNGNGNGNPN
jgi:hypothetical protein